MTHVRRNRPNGFALLEALIALVLILVGLVAVSQLQSMSLIGAGEGRARAEAAHLTQQRLEQLRNVVQKGEFTMLADSAVPQVVNGVNAVFNVRWDVILPTDPSPPRDVALPAESIELKVWTTWTDSRGTVQRFDLATVVAWDDAMASAYPFAGGSGNPVAPTGKALRGGEMPKDATVTDNGDGTEMHVDEGSKTTYLVKDGTVILTLPPKDDAAQSFARISGRVVFDKDGWDLTIGKPVLVRLSSEGECISSAAKDLGGVANTKYFDYTCYVGPGWYGNVGVSSPANPAICVGQPGYNADAPDGSTVSPDARRSATRTYRGFYQPDKFVLSAGMPSDGRYGTFTDKPAPFDGKPKPSGLAGFAVKPAAGAADDYLRQDFLVTKMKKVDEDSCGVKMSTLVFKYNAGRRVCISPNESGGNDCPEIWPGFDAPGACTIAIEGGVSLPGSVVEATFKGAPELPIGSCSAASGSDNYECSIPVPEDTLGTGVIVLNNLDADRNVLGTAEVPVPAACPGPKAKPVVKNF